MTIRANPWRFSAWTRCDGGDPRSLSHRVAAALRRLWRAHLENRACRATFQTLSCLDERTLRDLGFSRAQGERVPPHRLIGG